MLALKLATRFLFSKKQEKFISVNALLAIGSVALSVLVLIVVIGVMAGFDVSLRDKIMTMTPHIVINAERALNKYEGWIPKIKTDPEVLAASPFITGGTMMEAGGKVYSIIVSGIEPPEGYKVVSLDKYMKQGTLDLKRNEIILGSELAKVTGVKLGGILKIHSPAGGMDENFPPELIFTVKGIYECGLYDYDLHQVFIRLEDARLLFGFTTEVHAIGVAVKSPEEAGKVKDRIAKLIPDFLTIRTWIENNKSFFAALKTEKNVMFILLTFAVLIASLNIVSTLVMLVMEKFKDIGILKAIGFPRRLILRIFLIKGIMIGFIGTFIGTVTGVLFVRNIDRIQDFVAKYTGYEVFPPDVYYFDKIPTKLTPDDLTMIILLALSMAVLASVYPAIKAASLEAVEALRHE